MELEAKAQSMHLDAILLNETWTNAGFEDAEMRIDSFECFRGDRLTGTEHGGVCIYLRSGIPATFVGSSSVGLCEATIIFLSKSELIIASIYRSPSCKKEDFDETVLFINESISKILDKHNNTRLLILGDFNFPDAKWESCQLTNPLSHQILEKLIEGNNLHQMMELPTRGKNILDLLLTDAPSDLSEITTENNHNSFTDHRSIIGKINIHNLTPKVHKTSNIEETIFTTINFKDCDQEDWCRFRYQLHQNISSFNEHDNDESVEPIYNKFKTLINKLTTTLFRNRDNTSSKKKDTIPKFTKKLMKRRQGLNKAIDTANDHIKVADMTIEIDSITETIEVSLLNHILNKEIKATNLIKYNPKVFFQFARSKKKSKETIGPLINKQNQLINDPQEIANLLSQQYLSAFTIPNQQYNTETKSLFPIPRGNSHKKGIDIPLEEEWEIQEIDTTLAINDIELDTAPGPDGFTEKMLKEGGTPMAKILTTIFNISLKTSTIPKEWKEAMITPIYKSKARSDAANYRPISLTSQVAKAMEKILKKKIVNYLNLNNLTDSRQHGARSKLGTSTQLLLQYEMLLKQVVSGNNTDITYLDFAKAFDKIDHLILKIKLRSLGIDGLTGRWLAQFLEDRKQAVKVENQRSSWETIISGIPQGTVLGPLLFLIYITDIGKNSLIPKNIPTQDLAQHLDTTNNITHEELDTGIGKSDCLIFVDDTKLFTQINNDTDREEHQKNLDTLYKWQEDNNMSFNNSKFCHMSFGTNTQTRDKSFYLNPENDIITQTDNARDLGITFETNLSFSLQQQKVVKKMKQTTAWILRTLRSRQMHILLPTYRALATSHSEYLKNLWWPYNQIGLDKQLEQIQMNFLNKIKGLKSLTYTQQLSKCKLLSMKRKQEYSMLIWTYKNIANGRFEMSSTLRRGNFIIYKPLKGKVQKIKTLHWNSIFNMGPRLYNSMPKGLRDLKGDFAFYELVLKHLLHNIVPNNEEPILNFLPTYSSWSIPTSLGVIYWDNKHEIERKKIRQEETKLVLYKKKLQANLSSWDLQSSHIIGSMGNS